MPETEENPVDEILPRSYKGYFYGDNNITKLSRAISGSLDLVTFANEITTETDDSIKALCDLFKDDCPGIKAYNYNEMIAERFQQIILNAARTKKKKAFSSENAVESSRSLKEKYGAYLVSETRSCPNDGCAHSLYMRKNGKLSLVYEIAVIDPEGSKESIDNMIALCPMCYANYLSERTLETILRMKTIKKNLVDTYNAQEITADQSIQDSVRLVLEQIPKMKMPLNIDLNFDPVPVRNKIFIDNKILYSNIQLHVNLYYSVINDIFLDMDNAKRLRFKPFCHQVRLNYLNLKEMGYNQDKIYYHMTKWLYEATNEDWKSCEIVISYFVQKCEVFDVISK